MIDKFEEILNSITNGQRKQYLSQIKSLRLVDRAEFVQYLHDTGNTRLAIKTAQIIIKRDFT